MDFTSSLVGVIREESNSLICKEYEKGNTNFIKLLKLPEIDLLVCNFEYGTGINKISDHIFQVIEKKLLSIDKDINNLCKVQFENGNPLTEQMIYINMNIDFEKEDHIFEVASMIIEKIKETEYLFINDYLVDMINKKIINFR